MHAHQPFTTPTLGTALLARCPTVLSPYYHKRLASSAAKRLRVKWQLRMVASRFAQLAFVSDSERAVFEAAAGKRYRHASVVPPGVDDQLLAAEPMPVAGPVVLVVSRLVPHKQVDRVLEASHLLGPAADLRIIGAGPQEAQLRALCRALGYDSDQVFLGQLEDELVWRWYRSADLVVTMSREEAFGITIVEALAAGASVLASDLPTHRDAITVAGGEHRTRLVPVASTPQELAKEMAHLLESRMRGVGAATPPTWDDTTVRLEGLYQSL